MTGVGSPYEAPTEPDLVVGSDGGSVQDGVAQVLAELSLRGLAPTPAA